VHGSNGPKMCTSEALEGKMREMLLKEMVLKTHWTNCRSTIARCWVSSLPCCPDHYTLSLTLIATIPPPFAQWERYYIIPSTIIETLKHSFDPDQKETISAPRLDLSGLVSNAEGERVRVICTEAGENGKHTLALRSKDELLFTIKDGLVENSDFMFVSEEGWNNIVEW